MAAASSGRASTLVSAREPHDCNLAKIYKIFTRGENRLRYAREAKLTRAWNRVNAWLRIVRNNIADINFLLQIA
ncbi:MAG TPA: hypothetical protein VH684_17415 [Xanthobacteraceae bacterium]|jgi:hypothetical protein